MNTMTPIQESIMKASLSAEGLVDEIRDAHRESCDGNQLLEILLVDLIQDAVKIKRQLARINAAIE